MKSIRKIQFAAVLALALNGAAHAAPAEESTPENGRTFEARTFDDRQIVHVLNRLAFGPRAGDVETVRETGVLAWIDAQLRPETVDDKSVERKLSVLTTLRLTPAQLQNAYAADQVFQKMRKVEKARDDKPAKAAPQELAADETAPPISKKAALAARVSQQRQQEIAAQGRRNGFELGISVQAVGEAQNARLVRAAESNRQLTEVLVDFWSNHFNLDAKKGVVRTLRIADERDAIRPHVVGKFRDLLGASAKSPAMLFYLDNFRSTQATEIARPFKRKNRPAKRPIVDGVAMTDAEMDEMADFEMPKKMRGGINENYARELMELHTLGVGGGYSQKDVQEVARCFTGWSFDPQSGEFAFRPRQHDNGAKVVLGRAIPANGGIRDGEIVLDILAQNPATARHLSRRLCRRFVADEPPPALVERAAQVFLKSGGNLRATTRTIVTSPEFFAATGSKIKSPFEFAVSCVRALNGTIEVLDAKIPRQRLVLIANGVATLGRGNARAKGVRTLPRELATMGQPLFGFQAPTGWPEDSRSWVSAGALVARLNFSLALAGGSIDGIRLPTLRAQGENPAVRVQNLAMALLGTPLSPATQATIEKQLAPDAAGLRPVGADGFDTWKTCALILGSPEFQRR